MARLTGVHPDLVRVVQRSIRITPLFYPLAEAVKRAVDLEAVPIEWGGDWRTFKDGPHWQLPWKTYS